MLFSVVKFRGNLRQLNSRQKKAIIQYIVLLNIVMFSMIFFIAIRVHNLVKDQNDYFMARIGSKEVAENVISRRIKKIPINTKVTLLEMQDINLKDKDMVMQVLLGISYNLADFKSEPPKLDLYNGTIKNQKLISTTITDGRVNEQYYLDMVIEPNYQSELYPLDKELITIFFTPLNYDANYYFHVSDFIDDTDYNNMWQGDYKLMKMGFINYVESNVTTNENQKPVITYYAENRSYALFDHKSLYSYIKSIQYILLSLLIAIFALLINSKLNSPKNGRITVIGSSVFSLAANVFQINSTNRIVSQITLVDLITSFAALVIF